MSKRFDGFWWRYIRKHRGTAGLGLFRAVRAAYTAGFRAGRRERT